MFNSDTFANRPTFGIVGRIFISTDTKEFFRDTGTSWELIGGPGSGTITGSGAATQVAFWNGASTITGSNNLFWDSTNNYLGISTNTPTTALDVHHSTNSGAIFNQTTGTNNNTINFQTSGSGRWRIGNFYTAGADDFGIFDVVGSLQQLTILKTTGQTFIGAKTTASGRLVVNSATADAHLQVVGANSPSIRIDNAGSGGTQRFVFGLATATNNFIQGATAGQFCISTQSAGNMLFGMWQTINASEVMRITTSNNLVIGSTTDSGERFQNTGTAKITGNTFITAGNLSIFTTNTPRRINLEVANGSKAAAIGIEAGGSIHSVIGVDTSVGDSLQIASRSGIILYSGSTIGNIVTDPTNERMRLTTTGNLLVNSIVDNGNRLQVSGNVRFDASNVNVVARDNGTGYALFIAVGQNGSGAILDTGVQGSVASIIISGAPINSGVLGTRGSHELHFGTNSISRMYLTASGELNVTGAATFSSSIAINNTLSAAVAAPSTHKVAILIGGVQYYLLASNI
jgi:hypothetical protein